MSYIQTLETGACHSLLATRITVKGFGRLLAVSDEDIKIWFLDPVHVTKKIKVSGNYGCWISPSDDTILVPSKREAVLFSINVSPSVADVLY